MLAGRTPETSHGRDATSHLPSCQAIPQSNRQATMKVIIRSEPASASQYVARYIIRKYIVLPEHVHQLIAVERIKTHALTSQTPFVLGLPTGSSPKMVYNFLIEEHKAGNISFQNVITFNMVRSTPMYTMYTMYTMQKPNQTSKTTPNVLTNLQDEYVDLPRDHPESYHSFMFSELFSHIDIPGENVNILNGNAADLEAECAAFEAKIRAVGGIDLFLGGVGTDGHIAFNEPGSSLASRTRVKTLADETIRANARFFGGDLDAVPMMALTVGVQTIIEVCVSLLGLISIDRSIDNMC